ncbi:MAG: hypothetical protein OXH06_05320 [Gemmatimonadetes bacterium]|nr:hypothetical protein [Gemmatimonadota bacterium]MDE3258176.1 hypothetical protein [Gemmatimonadota bacterium]
MYDEPERTRETPEAVVAVNCGATSNCNQVDCWKRVWIALSASLCTLLIATSCGRNGPFEPVSGDEEERIRTTMNGRSFRQFDPSKDASPRKGVILDFTRGINLWAQYARDGHAVNEWEVGANDYRIEKAGNGSEFRISFVRPNSAQSFPDKCANCIQTSGVSISIRDVFDSGKISFKVNDPDGNLPLPFPVFKSWTKFSEDEYFD